MQVIKLLEMLLQDGGDDIVNNFDLIGFILLEAVHQVWQDFDFFIGDCDD
jgi:hypothetical protein